MLSYGFGALAGALYAGFAGFASPELFFWLTSGRVLIMVVVGGAGTLDRADHRRRGASSISNMSFRRSPTCGR